MKIKTEKQLTLPQLIEWAIDNDIRNRMFLTENSYCVGFDRHGYIYFNSTLTMPLDQVFTVEVEEEITEDTEIKGLVEFGNDGYGPHFFQCSGSSINEQKDIDSEAFYIMNDDKTMTLIWTKEKGLVE